MKLHRIAWLTGIVVVTSVFGALPAHAQVPTGSCASHVSSDFDGDGDDDLAIGVPGQDVSGAPNAGAVHIIYGTGTGLEATNDRVFTQNSEGVNDAAEAGDLFGACLAAGDLNNDGEGDLAIGAPDEDVGGIQDAGAVNVIYGKPTGLDPVGIPRDDFWHQDVNLVGGTAEAEDGFGSALAVGDFNGDGLDDAAMGVPFEDIGSTPNAGAINVLYGAGGGLSKSGQQLWFESQEGVAGSSGSGDEFGASLAAGNSGNGGQDDLVAGVPGESLSMKARAGAVHVIYGGASGLNTTDDRVWHQDSSGIEDDAEAQDRFGTAVAMADFDSDGDDDLAVGTPAEDVGGVANGGAVNVLNGSPTGLVETGDLLITQNTTSPADVAETADSFGASLAAADFENDGEADDDLAIGAPGEDSRAGAVEVVYGDDPNGLVPTAGNAQFLTQNTVNIGDDKESGDGFGADLVAGDYSADSIFALAIGVPREDVGSRSNAGAVNVLYGAAGGLDPSVSSNEIWHQEIAGIRGQAEAGDRFGSALG